MRVCQFRHFGPCSVDRKLLLHRREIGRLGGKIAERGLTLIPLRMYFKGGRAKIELGLGRGKKLHDKRATLRDRDQRRETGDDASGGCQRRVRRSRIAGKVPFPGGLLSTGGGGVVS